MWDSYVQGIVLGAYFYGYLVTQVPGGRLAEVVSGKWVFFVAVLMHLIPTILSPVMAEIHWGALVALRIIEGLGGGATLPAMNVLISKWAPKDERSLISSLCYGGKACPIVLTNLPK